MKSLSENMTNVYPKCRFIITGKNNGFPFWDILGYLKNTHKNPKLAKRDKFQPGNSQLSSQIGTCLTLPNLGFLWVFFKYPKCPKMRIRYFFLCILTCICGKFAEIQKITKARFRRWTFHKPNLIHWILYMKSSASESVRNACFNFKHLSHSFRLARLGISPLEWLWKGFDSDAKLFMYWTLCINYYNIFCEHFLPFELSSAAIKLGIWINSASLNNLGHPQFKLGLAYEKFGIWTGPKKRPNCDIHCSQLKDVSWNDQNLHFFWSFLLNIRVGISFFCCITLIILLEHLVSFSSIDWWSPKSNESHDFVI